MEVIMLISNRANTILLVLILAVGVGIVAILASGARGGPLDPPGPPSSTLPQVEPRIPIDHVPFAISTPGSYFLTQNVSGPANTFENGITISANDVTLDLNGFSVDGTAADGSQASGFGVVVSLSPAHNIVIRNGVVRDWNYGIVADNTWDSRIEDIRASNNKWDGIRGGRNTLIANCIASANGNDGIVSFGGHVRVCEVEDNYRHGIYVTDLAVVEQNRVATKACGAYQHAGIYADGSKITIQDNFLRGVDGNCSPSSRAITLTAASSNCWVMRNHLIRGVADLGTNNAVGAYVDVGTFGANTNPTTNYVP